MSINLNAPGAKSNARQGQPFVTSDVSFGLTSKLSAFGNGGETFDKLHLKFQEKIKQLNENVKSGEKYTIIKMLKQNAGLNYSAIIVAETAEDCTAAHVLMIEKTGEYPNPLIETIAGVRYEIIRTPADALDQKYVQQAQKLVAETLGVDVNTVVIVDGSLVPNEYDVNNDNLIQDLFVNTLNSVDSEIAIQVNKYAGINIADIINNYRNGKFFVNLFFNNNDSVIYDQTGMPVRQDICISLSFKNTATQNNKSVNQGNDSVEIVKTYGYIDFDWVGPMINGNMVGTQKFVPNFIITHIDSPLVPTPDIVMLAVASVLSINEDMNWMQAFRPNPGKKNEIDYNDIGALNTEGNIENSNTGFGKKINTKTKEFSLMDFNNAIQALVRPNLMVSIDIPKAGPETWFTSVFCYSKFSNSEKAIKRVYDSIAILTNGNNTINTAVPIFADISNKIHGGYYKTKDGIKDIRNLSSYLSVANYVSDTNQQPILISQYTNTLYNTSIPNELRAAERKKFIDNMSNNTAVYKQYYDRLTFSGMFLMNLVNSLRHIGFAPIFSNMGAVNDMFQRRSTTDFSGAMLGQDARFMSSNNMFGNFFMPGNYNRQF
ncbi:MAG: hypothetical protein ACD_33C00045G0031 [uncultured bacterium]|nr:MAG: hypothetical protein ACD_33C00045G0031 [uncultured bacterium]